MAIRIVRKGNTNINNDHNLLFNRGLANQHPIESITGLQEALSEKYTKPMTGIPSSDLSFSVVTQNDLSEVVSSTDEKILVIDGDITQIAADVQAIKDALSASGEGMEGTEGDATISFAYRSGFREEFLTEGEEVDFHLLHTFVADNQHLRVFRDGELLTPDLDYTEVSDTHVRMLYPLEPEVYLSFLTEATHTVFSPLHEEVISSDGQTDFIVQNKYMRGDHSLSVFVNGLRLTEGDDYEELDAYRVRLLGVPYPAATKFVFRQEGVQAAGQVLYHGHDYQQQSWSLDFVATEGQTIFDLSETYIPGANMILVSASGLVQWLGEGFDYMEVDEKQIRFNYPLEEGEQIKVTCIAALLNWNERFVSVEGQTVFNLTNVFYTGRNDILVYENGLQLTVDEDYTELSNRVIRLLDEPPFGSRITVYKRR